MKVIFILVLAFLLGAVLMWMASLQQSCEDKGGAYIKVAVGYKCVKVVEP